MTAKSETVGVVNIFGYGRFVLVEDHEAALAESDTRYARLYEIYRNKIDERDALISGLEALAGEWDARAAEPECNWIHGTAHKICASELLRALIPAAANTESEEGS